jgi:tricorn protease
MMSIASDGKPGAVARERLALAGILMSAVIGALALASTITGYAGAPLRAAAHPGALLPASRPVSDSPASSREGRLLRFPDIYKDRIVFSYGGDLWIVPSSGGVARRITSDPGLELLPKFSPDGQYIAFTGQYDGNFNVYVMPSEGGQPRQLTYVPDQVHVGERMGPDNQVINWMPDGKSILFLSRHDTFNSWFGRLFTVPIDGGLPVRFPLDKGGLTSFAPDGHQIAYNRIFRNFRTWKRYTGGMAQKISIFDLISHHYEQLTGYDGTDTFPMWHGDTIYFDSDRGPEKRMNLYSYNVATMDIHQLTHFKDFDVNWPSLGPDSIVFENGGYLHVFDLATQQTRKLAIYVPGDEDQALPHWVNANKTITSFDISPQGKRAVFTARGDVFTVPAKNGSIRNLTRTSGIREKYATWSPDGKWIAYFSDRSGEDELYIIPQDGSGPEQRITTDGAVFRLLPFWSPDSKKLVFADKDLRLYYVDVVEKKPVLIDQGHYFDITDYVWSPDSRWIAYSKIGKNTNGVIYLYSLADKKITPVTTDFYGSWNPMFDPDGKYLYFLSNRDYNEVIGVYDNEFSNPKATRVFTVTLRKDEPSPFAPKSDEENARKSPDVENEDSAGAASSVSEKKSAPDADAKTDKDQKGKPGKKGKGDSADKTPERQPMKEPLRMDLDGIADRVVALPMPPGVVSDLGAASGYVYYLDSFISGLSGPIPGETAAIHAFDMKEGKDHVLLEDADNFTVSFDGKKILYSSTKHSGEPDAPDHTYGIIDAKPVAPLKAGEGALDLKNMKMEVDPRAEWTQIFNEMYRQERDYFFEQSMNGVDWAGERDKYAALLPYVATRFDLNYVLGEMIGELSNSHTYGGGGDYPDLKPVNVGMLGADFELDSASGRYRIKKIYRGKNWDNAVRSPLTEPGVDVHEGDYLLAVNGRVIQSPENPYKAFVNTANDNVALTVNSTPTEAGARHVTVKTLQTEFNLRELDMIETNRRKVDQATNGRVGYIYLPDMEDAGLNAFIEQFFPQIRKEGLIIDVRYNGGGFVDQLIFERLRRILAGMGAARNFESGTTPDVVFHGPMAAVTNEYAASDGDIFSYYFKYYHLGPLIGMRTWGGVRGIRGYFPMIDGGYITRPEFAMYGLDSQWVVENHGVQPDIVVDNTPDQVLAGHDPQLERAISEVMKQLPAKPQGLPSRPPDLPAYPPGPGE